MRHRVFVLALAAVLVTLAGTTMGASVMIGPGAGTGSNSAPDTGDRLNVERDFVPLPALTYNIDSFSFDSSGTSGTVTPFLATGSPSTYTTVWVGPDFNTSATGIVTDTYAPGSQTVALSSAANMFAGVYTAGGRVDYSGGGNVDHDNSYPAPTPGSTIDGFSNGNLGRTYAFEVNLSSDVVFSTATMSGDADSGIAVGKLYTHAVDTAGTAAGRSVNGVPFERALPPSGGNTSGANWSITGANNGWTGSSGNVTGDTGTLISDFWYNGNPQTTTLTGLEPGRDYIATWYGRGFGPVGDRVQTVSVDDGTGGPAIGLNVFDQNFSGDGNGNLLNLAYTAPASGEIRVSFTPHGAASFHQYAFTNELLGPPHAPFDVTQPANDWSAEIEAGTYSHALNFGSGAVATSVNGVPFTAAGTGAFPSGGGNNDYTNAWGGVDGNNITGDNGLADKFLHDGGSQANINLTGLIPGQQYRAKLFFVGWDGTDRTTLLDDLDALGEETSFNPTVPGVDNGTVVSYVYTAQPDGQLNLSLSFPSNASPHTYALTNQLLAAGLSAGTFTPDPLTGDVDSGIAAGKAYTHAINLNHTGNTTVSGAVFTGSGANVDNPGTNNYRTANMANNFVNNGNPVTGDVNGLLTEFLYDGDNPETLTLRNLRPGQKYVATFYNTAFGGVGGRLIDITTSQGDQIAFDQNFTNDRNGNLLRYEYVAQGTSMTFAFSPLLTNASMHQYAFSNEMSGYKALLTDNFYAPGNPDTYDVNFNLEARQGGRLAVGGATVTYTPAGNQQVGNATGSVDGGNYLLSAFNGTTALDHNFNDADSAGGLLIAFDMAPNLVANADTSVWGAISLGLSQADRNAFINTGAEHFGILFRGNGGIQAFDGSTDVTGGAGSWTSSTPVTNQLHHFELLLTDPTDSNPFDGVGQTNIDIFADGLSVYSFVKTGGGYANNYINFSSTHIGGFDNLMIAQAVPEPSTFVLAALGLLGLGLLGRRRRRAA